MTTRIYDDRVDLDSNDIKEFWAKRALSATGLKTVLLGDDKGAQAERNRKECSILEEALSGLKSLRILDIGCGIGRWVENLGDKIETYTGIDFTAEYVRIANEKYADKKDVNFYEMSVCNMSEEVLSKDYNLVICTGVLTYINDNELPKIFEKIRELSPEYVYIQESISLMDGRLTLDKFESKELKSNYSAIYRTQAEYEQYFKDFDIIKTDLLLDDEIGGRKETNARYWIGRTK